MIPFNPSGSGFLNSEVFQVSRRGNPEVPMSEVLLSVLVAVLVLGPLLVGAFKLFSRLSVRLVDVWLEDDAEVKAGKRAALYGFSNT